MRAFAHIFYHVSASSGTATVRSTHPPRQGRIAAFRELQRFRRHRLDVLGELAAERRDLAELAFPGRQVFIVTEPELAREVLVQQDASFVKSAGLRRFSRPLLGDGLLTSEHDKHRRQRKIMSPGFQPARIAGYADTMAERTEAAQAGWRDGDSIDVAEEMMRLTLDIAARTMFGAEVAEHSQMVGKALTHAMEYVMDSVTSLMPIPLGLPTPRNLRLRRYLGQLDRLVYRIIDQRPAGGEDRGDILSMLLGAADEDGTGMDRAQLRDEVITLFMAGHETTANALAWTMYLLDRHPDVAAELRAEADRVLAGRLPGAADLPRLPLATQVMQEAMRLYPPAYIVGREAERELWVGSQRVPPGAFVFVNIFGLHRRPDVYPEPLAFVPARFAGEAERALPRGAYVPFGGGGRICIGNHFAMMEGTLLLAHLMQRVELAGDGRTLVPEPLMTLRPRGGLPMTVRRRS
jgi:cytochrome P450